MKGQPAMSESPSPVALRKNFNSARRHESRARVPDSPLCQPVKLPKGEQFMDDSFIVEEKGEYQRLNGGIPRSIVQVSLRPEGSDERADTGVVRSMAAYIGDEVDWLTKLHQHPKKGVNWPKLESVCIQVKEDDGMTWSAEAVNSELRRRHPKCQHWLLANYMAEFELPLISKVVGITPLLKIAAKNKLLSLYITAKPWMRWVILGAAVLVAFAVKLLEVWQKAAPSSTVYIIIGASAALALVSQHAVNYLNSRTGYNQHTNFKEGLAKALGQEQLPNYYLDFVGDIARHLQSHDFPRCVIIDNYERLDLTTKHVIERYFAEFAEGAKGVEFWVIFEAPDGGTFSKLADPGKKGYGFKRTRTFRQLLLDKKEKERLLEMLPGRGEGALDYNVVKLIAKETTEGEERIKRLAEQYRNDHRKETAYDPLDFLYLLSLTASTRSFFLPYQSIISTFAVKSGLRAQVLRQFLQGSGLNRGEFENILREVETNFKPILITKGEGDYRELNIHRETELGLTKYAQVLDLPRKELGHLFWALYWYDRKGPGESKGPGQTKEAFWMRKLSEHLLPAAPLGEACSENHKESVKQLFAAALFTTGGCLQTGVFGDIPPLLKKAEYLLEVSELPGGTSGQQGRLLKNCWEAYSVLGQDSILKIILNLNSTPTESVDKDAKDAENPLEKLFFDAMPLHPSSRATLKPNFFRHIDGARGTVESVSNYAQARSAWLALSASPLLLQWNFTGLHKALLFSDKILEDLTRKAIDGAGRKADENIRVTDIITLSLSLWCYALRFNDSVREITRSDPVENFKALIDMATSAVLKAVELKKEASIYSGGSLRMDFLASGLARELYTISLAAIVMANKLSVNGKTTVADSHAVKEINELLRFSEEFFDEPLNKLQAPSSLTSKDFVTKISEAMKVCGIIWDRFELHSLRDYINVRKIHFNAVCSIGSAINNRGFIGLTANLVVADCLRQAGSINAYYLHQAASMVVHEDFGLRLKNELSLLVLKKIHNLNYDFNLLLNNILEEVNGRESFLLRALKRLDKDLVSVVVLGLFNVIENSGRPGIIKRVKEIITPYASQIKWPDVKAEVEELLSYFSILERKNEGKSLEPSEIIEEWKERKGSDYYAGTLNLLIQSGHFSEDIERESSSVLNTALAQDKYANTTYLYLAWSLIKHLRQVNEKHIPVEYLAKGIETWKFRINPDVCFEIYTFLSLALPAVAHFKEQKEYWGLIKMRKMLLEQIPAWVNKGNYFFIFYDYCTTMINSWGLKMSLKLEELKRSLETDFKEKRARLVEWKENGAIVPAPLSRHKVSAEFLFLGEYLFGIYNDDKDGHRSADGLDNDFLDNARTGFNLAARESMDSLLKMVMDLPQLPKSIKQLLLAFSEKLTVYT
jgi:hypothetical protein